jgi:hypothetical protein
VSDEKELANGDQPEEPAGEVDSETCNCGGFWVSDGEGGRYCEQCLKPHPDDPKQPLDGNGAAVKLADADPRGGPDGPGPGDLRPAREAAEPSRKLAGPLFHDFFAGIGAAKKALDDLRHVKPGGGEYQEAMGHLDAADRVVAGWRSRGIEEVTGALKAGSGL